MTERVELSELSVILQRGSSLELSHVHPFIIYIAYP